jgi:hypothetical protein
MVMTPRLHTRLVLALLVLAAYVLWVEAPAEARRSKHSRAFDRAPDSRLAPRYLSKRTRKRFSFGAKQDVRVDVRANNRRLEQLAKRHPDTIKLTRLGVYGGEPIYRVDVAAKTAQLRKGRKGRKGKRGRAPLKVLLASGVHGNEPTGVHTTMKLLDDLLRKPSLRSRYAVTIVPMVNPSGLAAMNRKNDREADLNRRFAKGKFSPETAAVARSLRGERYDLFVDLHGAARNGFFLIRRDDDRKLSGRILAAMPSASLLSAKKGERAVGPYGLHSLGGAQTNTGGTFKGFMDASKARHSYTLEYPRRLSPRKQSAGLMKLLRSTLDNVYRHGAQASR